MKDLIEALTIMLKYGNPQFPTHCEHDRLTICGIDPDKVSSEDHNKLKKLGFFICDGLYISYRFGSA